ncbi:MAG: response regulator [Planctomycetota bacterium]|nr:response regulator [Planctomycetota bacterium]
MSICNSTYDGRDCAIMASESAAAPSWDSNLHTVLVVDDSSTDRCLVGALLREIPNLRVEFATNGREALQRIRRRPPDLVITDLVMPDVDGLELVSQVGQQYPLLPVILMTSSGSEDLASRAVKSGARGYVPKTALSRVLPGTVERLLTLAHEKREQRRLLESITATELTLVLKDNDTSLIEHLIDFVGICLRNAGLCTEGGETLVCLALEEALQNAFLHGNLEIGSALRDSSGDQEFAELVETRRTCSPYRDRRVSATISVSPRAAKFVVRDEGPGFDPSQVPDPTAPEHLEKLCGRGLLLMRSFMDEVTFNTKGNEVTLIKYLGPRPSSAE